MNLKVTKNIQQLVAQRRAKKIETVRNEVITVNLKDARAKLAESTGAKQVDSPTTPTSADPQDGDLVADAIIALADHIQQLAGKSEDTPQVPAPDTASLSPMGEDTHTPVDTGVSSGTGLESVDTQIPPVEPDAPVVPVKKPTRSRSRSKSKAKK